MKAVLSFLLKRFKLLILIIVVFMMTTGCVKYDVAMDITKEDVSFKVIYAIEKEELEDYADYHLEFKDIPGVKEKIEFFKEQGYKIKDYETKQYSGVVATISLGEMDDLDEGTGEELSITDILNLDEFNEETLFNYNKGLYSANFVFKKESLLGDLENDFTNTSEINTLEGEYIFSVTLPNKVYSHNADKVGNNGKTLIWEIPEDSEKIDINFSFKLGDSLIIKIVLWIVGILVLIFVITFLSERINRFKRKRVLTEQDIKNSENSAKIVNINANVGVDETFIESNFGTTIDSDPVFGNLNNNDNISEQGNFIERVEDYKENRDKPEIKVIPEDALDEEK